MSFLVNDPGVYIYLYLMTVQNCEVFLIGIILNEENASKTETRREKIVVKLYL